MPDGDGAAQSEPSSSASGNSDLNPPSADLRSVRLRPGMRDTARVDELFVRKNPAAAENASARPSPAPDATQEGAAQSGAVPEAGPEAACEILSKPEPAVTERPGRASDTVRAAAKKAKTRRASLLTPIQEAIIVFGCIALMVSLRVFDFTTISALRPTALPEPPQIVAPEMHPLSAAVADALARGDERLKAGDVVAARVFYKKAADAGNARAALMMGATYDTKFLASIGLYGLRGNERAALDWYRRANELGDHESAKLDSPAAK